MGRLVMMDEHLLDTVCPWCERHNQFSTNMLNSGGPRPGDVSVCWTCGGLARFTEGLGLARMGLEEQAEMFQTPVYQAYLKARAVARRAGR